MTRRPGKRHPRAVFSDRGLVGVVTHSVDLQSGKRTVKAVSADETAAGCSILDRYVDRQSDRFVDRAEGRVRGELSDTMQLQIRDLVMAIVGWLLKHFFSKPAGPGPSPA